MHSNSDIANLDGDEVLKAFHKAREFNLCPNRIWAVAGGNLPKLLPKSNVVPVAGLKSEENENFKDHDECTSDFCEYSQRDFTAVEQRHECNNKDRCMQLQDMFPRDILADAVLAENGNSTTVWNLNGKSILDPPRPYMAISHVWADGTGTGAWKDGEVNECLYEFFQDIAKRFECEGIWWDTLCIPRPKAARTEAIKKIQSSYENARITLVHDCFLRSWTWDPETACFAILMSPWFSRGWTALELSKSPKVKVIFKGPYGPLIKDLDEDILTKYEDILAKDGKPKSPREEASLIIWNLRGGVRTLNKLLTVLGPRHTSWPKDMATISALLVGVAPKERQQDTYKSILREFDQLAPGHLFHNSTTMSQEFSWCPPKLFDLPLDSSKASLAISQDGDIKGKWRVLPLGHNIEERCWWNSTHSLVKRRLQAALRSPGMCRLLAEYHPGHEAEPVIRALLVREMPDSTRYQYVGALYFRQELRGEGAPWPMTIKDVTIAGYQRNEEATPDQAGDKVTEDQGDATHSNAEKDDRPNNAFDVEALNCAIWRVNYNIFKELIRNATPGDLDLLQNPHSSEGPDYPKRLPLHLAAERGDRRMVQELIHHNVGLNARCFNGETALHRAAWGGSTGVVELLLKAGGKEMASKTNKKGNTALHTAAQAGFAPVVQLLMEKIDINAKGSNGLTPLHFAAMNGHRSVVEVLERANVEAGDNKIGWTPLHCAADHGDLELVELLIHRGAAVNAQDDRVNWTPLHLAAMNGHKAVVESLLKRSADSTPKDKCNWTPRQFAEMNGHVEVLKLLDSKESKSADAISANDDCWTPLHCKAINSKPGIVKVLVGDGAEVYYTDKGQSWTPLLFAIENELGTTIQRLLKVGASVNSMVDKRNTLLHWAAKHGNKVATGLLLDAGADKNAISKDMTPLGHAAKMTPLGYTAEMTPLGYAAKGGHKAVVRQLLDAGADTEIGNVLHQAVLGRHTAVLKQLLGARPYIAYVKKRQYGTLKSDPLHLAVDYGSAAAAGLLIDAGAPVDARNELDETPLHKAVFLNKSITTRLLLDAGADKDATDSWSRTPLHDAAEHGHEAVLQLLLDANAKKDNKDRQYSRTPLHFAAQWGKTEAVRLLLDAGAIREAKSSELKTPLDYAVERGHETTAQLLREHCACSGAEARIWSWYGSVN